MIKTNLIQPVGEDSKGRMRIQHKLFAGIFFVLWVTCLSAKASSIGSKSPDAPPQAAAVGFTALTFSSTFSADEVDMTDSLAPGFRWYPYRFFGGPTKLGSIDLNSGGGVTLLGDKTGPNGELATASPIAKSGRFVGTAFGGGGYFEATFKFNPQDVINTKFDGWPSWWSMAIEHMVGLDTKQWPGQQDGYEHFIEADFFEYDLESYASQGRLNYFGGALHDWFGFSGGYNQLALPSRFFVREIPPDTDFTQCHRYGFLWVPATGRRDGYAEYYFDGRRVGRRIAWRQYAAEAPPPKPPRMFSIIDRNHLVLILGTGPNQTMTVQSVNVWQAQDTANLKR